MINPIQIPFTSDLKQLFDRLLNALNATIDSINKALTRTGGLDMQSQRVYNVGAAVNDTDAATKGYVDSAISRVPAMIRRLSPETGGAAVVSTNTAVQARSTSTIIVGTDWADLPGCTAVLDTGIWTLHGVFGINKGLNDTLVYGRCSVNGTPLEGIAYSGDNAANLLYATVSQSWLVSTGGTAILQGAKANTAGTSQIYPADTVLIAIKHT